ncbi:uncharacterized protein BT62DRAFT_763485 [Guyanagaster necrorhizus]|uniref:F-box domain-containing protein n=1 Tax=Guyanagaster necrorhizus TaxID=856835 RepID=A0A9P7VWP2_9AGAR|nr:uncharacterized protein BT62DRAFT_763485 [Guyanagaster necrorhizus MCA 3950]KAG7448292.1 hypothetical protein BT62DRAFT_763485 [Guyanagaster necrorhizus MCA 3950]
MIQWCPNLQTFHMQLICSPPLAPVSLTPPFRSSLRDLTACEGPIFRSVILPQLEKIHVVSSGDEICHDDALPGLLSLLQRSQCSLVSLELTNVIFTDIIFDILHCIPHINTLKLSTRCWATGYDRIFKALIDRLASHPSTQQSFLPLLRNLHITINDVLIKMPCAFIDHVFFEWYLLDGTLGSCQPSPWMQRRSDTVRALSMHREYLPQTHGYYFYPPSNPASSHRMGTRRSLLSGIAMAGTNLPFLRGTLMMRFPLSWAFFSAQNVASLH